MKRRSLLALGLGSLVLDMVASDARAARSISVGVLPGPHAEIMAVVQGVARDAGLELRLVEREGGRGLYNDVMDGRLDAACFEDGVTFATASAHRAHPLAVVTPTVTLPFALYSRHVASLRQLAPGATLAIAGEPAAASRALVLLHNHGLIQLREGPNLRASPHDVISNRFGFKLLQLPSARLFDTLTRVDAAVIDRPNAERAGLQPGRDSIGVEDARSPWADVLTVRGGDMGASWVATLAASYRSEPVKRFILNHYQDSVRRPW